MWTGLWTLRCEKNLRRHGSNSMFCEKKIIYPPASKMIALLFVVFQANPNQKRFPSMLSEKKTLLLLSIIWIETSLLNLCGQVWKYLRRQGFLKAWFCCKKVFYPPPHIFKQQKKLEFCTNEFLASWGNGLSRKDYLPEGWSCKRIYYVKNETQTRLDTQWMAFSTRILINQSLKNRRTILQG